MAGLRGISTVIAGIIVAAFIIVALIPLIINAITSSTVSASKMAELLQKKVSSAIPALNVTYEGSTTALTYDGASLTARRYIVSNPTTVPQQLAALVLRDSEGRIAVVKPTEPYFNSTVLRPVNGTSIYLSIRPLSGTVTPTPGGYLVLAPGSQIEVLVANGELLVTSTPLGTVLTPEIPPAGTAGNATVAEEEVVKAATGIKATYVSFEIADTLDKLFSLNQTNIIITTDLSSNQTNTTLLESGLMKTICYFGDNKIDGAFHLSGSVHISRIVITNLMPLYGSLILGGGGGSYTSKPFKVNMLITAYYINPILELQRVDEGKATRSVNYTNIIYHALNLPTLTILYDNPSSIAFCTMIPSQETYTLIEFSNNDSLGKFVNYLCNRLQTLYYYEITNYYYSSSGSFIGYNYDYDYHSSIILCNVTSGSTIDISLSASSLIYSKFNGSIVNIIFAAPNGLLAVTNDLGFVLYCPKVNFLKDNNGGRLFSEHCVLTIFNKSLEAYVVEPLYVNISVSELTSTTIVGLGGLVYNVTYDPGVAKVYKSSCSISTPKDQIHPFRIKILDAHTYVLSLYSSSSAPNYPEGFVNDTSSFGLYYYVGNNVYSNALKMRLSVAGLYAYSASNATLKLYDFGPGVTGGLDAYAIIADTDRNGLPELIFQTEAFKPGKSNTPDDTFTDIFTDKTIGCQDYSVGRLYLKFVGSGFAVNGSEVAQVVIQFRYYFHDNAGDDTDDIDNPSHGIFGFYLVDAHGDIVSSKEYIYQQLDDVEDTWPPNTNFLSDAAYVPVPNEPELYYVVFGVSDPYGTGNVDDLDFTLAIEWVGVWYLYR